MNLNGTFTFHGPRPRVWELLQDPAVLAKALPGTERLELTADDRFEGVMKVSVGPVTAARFDVTVIVRDRNPPHSFVMDIDSKGSVGHSRGTASIVLQEQGEATVMEYASNLQVGGRIAAVGQRLLESVSRSMMRQALEALERELRIRLSAESGPR